MGGEAATGMLRSVVSIPHHHHEFVLRDRRIELNQKKTMAVAALSSVVMLVEIIAGRWTGSMALLAQGFHMSSHVGTLSIALAAYSFARSVRFHRNFSFGAGKMIPLGGYTSSIILTVVGLLVGWESIERFVAPENIQFPEAIGIATLGLSMNIVSLWLLRPHPHPHSHPHPSPHVLAHVHDLALHGTFLHLISDLMMDFLAVLSLVLSRHFNWLWLDSLAGLAGAFVILRWASHLFRHTSWELLDGHARSVDRDRLRQVLESNRAKVLDLHVWRIAPDANACEIIIETSDRRGPDYYRDLIFREFHIHHAIIEERVAY
ncbi:MAG: cation transporter [Bdellovibrio sp.]|nr:MAG: cation transporter [Bdellovibrio sp.]